jgi:hypothetical protein
VEVPVPDDQGDAEEALKPFLGGVHESTAHAVDLEGYGASGLPARVMRRGLGDDPLFFAAALAAGAALGAVAGG